MPRRDQGTRRRVTNRPMADFDWHGDAITPLTVVDAGYRNTHNVRRFLVQECGSAFKFDRSFMAWIKDGSPKTMGDVAREWRNRQAAG